MPFAVAPVMGLLAATPAAGYTLVNGTGTIITWTAPADGQLHRVIIIAQLLVTSNETGGQVTVNFTDMNGNTRSPPIYAGGSAAGLIAPTASAATQLIKSGTAFSLFQGSALTLGAAVLWAEVWGS
jgi:hypothetical protein